MQNQQVEPFLTTTQVAEYLNINSRTVRRWSDKGILPCWRISSRGDRRYKKEDLDLLLFESWLFDYDKIGNKPSNTRLVNALKSE